MATVTKDFRIKSGLVVEGTTGTINGNNILTEGSTTFLDNKIQDVAGNLLEGATLQNIAVTYDDTTNALTITAENGIADSTTSDLVEGTNLYFTAERAQDAIADALANGTHTNITVDYDDNNNAISLTGAITYTDADARNAISGGNGIDYNSTTGEIAVAQTLTNQTLANPTITVNPGGTVDAWVGDATSYPMSFDSTSGPTIVINVVDPDGDYLAAGLSSATTIYIRNFSAGPGSTLWYDQLELSSITPTGYNGHDYQLSIMMMGLSQGVIDALTALNGAYALYFSKPATTTTLSASELSMLDGVSSNIQTQINTKASSSDLSNHASSTHTHGVTGDIVGTSSVQGLTNKTIGDELGFGSSGSTYIVADGEAVGNLDVVANNSLHLSSSNGDIVLKPDMVTELGKAYIGSTTAGNEIATHSYVDNAISGLTWKESVNVLGTSNIADITDITTVTIDGHVIDVDQIGYRILLTGQSTASENGIYEVVASATPGQISFVRAADSDTVAELLGAAVFVMEGTTYNATSWVQNNHYATTFDQLTWTQFSGSGNYTAGFGINLVGREFSADTTEMATSQALTDAVSNLTDYVDGFLNSTDGTTVQYIDAGDAATLLAANGYSDTLVANGDATATPTYKAISIDSIAKQVATIASATEVGTEIIAHSFSALEYRSAKFLVKLAAGTHTEVSEILLTLDTSNNVAITEYGIVGTNGSLGTISAAYEPVSEQVRLLVNSENNVYVSVVGTLLV